MQVNPLYAQLEQAQTQSVMVSTMASPELKSQLRTMALAEHLADKPDFQVRDLAKQYYTLTKCEMGRTLFKVIISCNMPAATMWVAYLQLENQLKIQ